MSEERFILTRPGYERLQNELSELQQGESEKIGDVADTVSDTSLLEEDGSMEAVLMERDRTQERIRQLEHILARAEVIDHDLDARRVSPGDRVTLWDTDNEEEIVHDLLSSAEIAFGQEGISTDSPVGKALLGHVVGDTVDVETPDGKICYTIRKIEGL
jgi:transcription elongation factor GreA